jgi:hypothetical protein
MDLLTKTLAMFLVTAVGCARAPQHVGNGILNVQPDRPVFAGQLDFELLPSARGTACSKVHSGYAVASGRGDVMLYWSDLPIAGSAPTQVRGLVAAASLDALEKMPNADTMIVTRVMTEAKGPDETCAYVYGRGIRLKKAGTSNGDGTTPSSDRSTDEPDDDDDDFDRRD